MSKIIIIYSTIDGHTKKICSRLLNSIQSANIETTLIPIEDEDKIDLNQFDKIILGASIRYGKHHRNVYDFINKHIDILSTKPNAFFSVNLVARKQHRNQSNTNPYVKKFLSQITWKPDIVYVFAGKIDYQKYNFFDRNIIRMIMWITKGPTHPTANIEFTDWEQVDKFAELICKV